MKIIKASQLVYVISEDATEAVEITAVRVNRLCSRLKSFNIFCELSQMDFEELMMRYPNEISMTELEIKVYPNPAFVSSIQNYFRFESDLISKEKLQKYWEETK